MYCSLDKIDFVAHVDERPVAVQVDHRTHDEIAADRALSTLFALARVLNARDHLATEGVPEAAVHYVVVERPPPEMCAALAAAGATLEHADDMFPREQLGGMCLATAGTLADAAFASVARAAAVRMGTRDLAVALRMLEDQTLASPPTRDDEATYWSRILELAALAGEVLRAKHPVVGRWVHSDRALIPFGFQLERPESHNATLVFPTNRAQRLVDEGGADSLFTLLLAANEALASPPDATTGRLMPSLRARETIDLDETVWTPLLADHRASGTLPVIVCGVDGENTFGMVRSHALDTPATAAMEQALANLATEEVHTEELHADGMMIVVVSGGFYAAEKLLDGAFMRRLHDELGAYMLAAATPARGLLLVTDAGDSKHLARFAQLAQLRYEDSGTRAISPAVMLVTDGTITGCVGDAHSD